VATAEGQLRERPQRQDPGRDRCLDRRGADRRCGPPWRPGLTLRCRARHACFSRARLPGTTGERGPRDRMLSLPLLSREPVSEEDATGGWHGQHRHNDPGSKTAAIANIVVRLTSHYTGRGPTKARRYINENLVTVALQDALTKGERTLVAERARADDAAGLPGRGWCVAVVAFGLHAAALTLAPLAISRRRRTVRVPEPPRRAGRPLPAHHAFESRTRTRLTVVVACWQGSACGEAIRGATTLSWQRCAIDG
jgi:hypothetical protein